MLINPKQIATTITTLKQGGSRTDKIQPVDLQNSTAELTIS
jgi:hypothetical protein